MSQGSRCVAGLILTACAAILLVAPEFQADNTASASHKNVGSGKPTRRALEAKQSGPSTWTAARLKEEQATLVARLLHMRRARLSQRQLTGDPGSGEVSSGVTGDSGSGDVSGGGSSNPQQPGSGPSGPSGPSTGPGGDAVGDVGSGSGEVGSGAFPPPPSPPPPPAPPTPPPPSPPPSPLTPPPSPPYPPFPPPEPPPSPPPPSPPPPPAVPGAIEAIRFAIRKGSSGRRLLEEDVSHASPHQHPHAARRLQSSWTAAELSALEAGMVSTLSVPAESVTATASGDLATVTVSLAEPAVMARSAALIAQVNAPTFVTTVVAAAPALASLSLTVAQARALSPWSSLLPPRHRLCRRRHRPRRPHRRHHGARELSTVML